MNSVKRHFYPLIRLMRPVQWVKNAFVFTGFLFGKQLSNLEMLKQVSLAAVAFCLISSSVYILNDMADAEMDRRHPQKKKRPIPAGEVTLFDASVLSAALAIAGLLIGAWVSINVAIILVAYAIINILYSYSWKHIVIVDVFCISAGFMLRILAGTIGVGIPPSKWLLFCGMMITLFLGFAKRRAEGIMLGENKEEHRQVLEHYEPLFLEEVIAICATGVIVSYSLYTMSAHTVLIHRTENLIFTVPFVIYGIFRYLYLLHHCHLGGDPTKDLMKDPHIVAVVAGWGIATASILYLN